MGEAGQRWDFRWRPGLHGILQGVWRVCPDSVQVLGVSTSTLSIGLELWLLQLLVIEGDFWLFTSWAVNHVAKAVSEGDWCESFSGQFTEVGRSRELEKDRCYVTCRGVGRAQTLPVVLTLAKLHSQKTIFLTCKKKCICVGGVTWKDNAIGRIKWHDTNN